MNWHLETAKLELNLLQTEDIINFATNALSEGQDTPSLRILAGLSGNDTNAVREYLRETLKELNIEIPSKEEAAWLIIRAKMEDIVNRNTTPHEGIHSIIWDVYPLLSG